MEIRSRMKLFAGFFALGILPVSGLALYLNLNPLHAAANYAGWSAIAAVGAERKTGDNE